MLIKLRLMMVLGMCAALMFGAAPTAFAQSTENARAASADVEEGEVVDAERSVSVTGGVRDDQISSRLAGILDATGWYSDVQIGVEDGIVFMDGLAVSSERQKWAGELAAKTDGVVAVVNRLKVAGADEFSVDPALQELSSLYKKAIAAIPLVLLALLILPLGFFLSVLVARLSRWALQDRLSSPFLVDIVARCIALPVFLVGLYIVLQIAGLTQLAISVLGGAGVLGIVIGFAFRDIAENFLASLLLSLRQPFRRGDLVNVDGRQGVIHSMNTRSTVLVSPEGNHIQIPNATVFKSTIENFSASPQRRGEFDVGIGYDAAISEAQEIVLKELLAHEAISTDPEPMVLAEALGASTVSLRVYYWFDGANVSALKIKSVLMRRVKKALLDAGISMPDEAREIIFPEGVPFTPAAAVQDATVSAPSHVNESEEPDRSIVDEDLRNETQDLDEQMQVSIEGDDDGDLLRG
ncbi:MULTISPECIES: mechanosensitive ion channel family protein [Halocynthiibacter]|uniref:Small-conductance mechanosensitive channel n=1 Tax=Halocynthiibacter halioticoli TaxID=2986804 RepID=A0AAE3LTB6_9RHOB|nr:MULTISPECIES: mechanosensitive ion channel family protein [Halocynthiibacter]MCV6824861.1 mechanosensitive ion channel [Halocynthiibacter halioticoli]MCW4057862.1 mechanosensitive ion channel [Halocynthiibacter sp. SDUM655004]